MIRLTRRSAGLVAFVFAFLAFTGASDLAAQEESKPREVREFRGQTMGTTYMVKVAGADDVD